MAKGRFEAKGGAPTITGFLIILVLLAAVVAGGVSLWKEISQPRDPVKTVSTPKKKMSKKEQEAERIRQEEEQRRQEEEQRLLREANARREAADQARELCRSYRYDEALELLRSCPGTDEQTTALMKEIQDLKDALVLYEDEQYYHIFFHSLIVDTAKAFDGDYDAAGYDLYMTTTAEFKAMLPLLQEAGFILYDIRDMVEFVDGEAVLKDIYLPEGKKPLVISIDDVNYYEYMQGDGFAERMDVDEDGNVVTIVDGEATYDGDVVPILDAYVREHPEFSWQGAKGVVAITGYEGAFGYRITDLELYDQKTQDWMIQKTRDVSEALRNTGWEIACHSYTHNSYWSSLTITMEEEQYDIGRWKRDIAPYVGGSDIFIAPFGVSFPDTDQRFRYLVDNGFHIYCSVDSLMPCYVKSDYFFQGRLNLDGLVMKQYPGRISKYFFDPAEVLDETRP